MKCEGCGNENAAHIKIAYTKAVKIEMCDKCGNIRQADLPDIYCPEGGYFDENLADKEHRKGQYIYSKRHKREILRRLNLQEAGDMKNECTGKVTPYFKDPEKRRRYCLENFG